MRYRNTRPRTKAEETPEIVKGFSLPSSEYLHECFVYDEISGALFWKKRPLYHFDDKGRSAKWKQSVQWSRRAGKAAFTLFSGHYRCGVLNGKRVYAHRIIWKMVHGVDPRVIDHINGDKLDNRIHNLRSVTHQENLRNTRRDRKNNTSGHVGVSRHASIGFNAYIHDTNGRPIKKWFKTKTDAIEWRKVKETEYGYRLGAEL
ncbi:MAG TPA: HNH endonuclease signature motif containing protein [Hyphomonas sp.]|nr:HNH endonuclease signature motif containing protein [Hyphomonas sp.]